MSWADRYTRSELASELDALTDRAPVLTLAAKALRDGDTSDALADAVDDHGYMIAMRWGNYDEAGVCKDASDALRDDEHTVSDGATLTGTFRALRSSVIAGVAVTEFEEDATHERYVLAGLGHPEQPPELVRLYETDPDEDMGDDHA
jgi:hypothetical protein